MFRDDQNKLGYCHKTGMAEVAKPIIMANAVHQVLLYILSKLSI